MLTKDDFCEKMHATIFLYGYGVLYLPKMIARNGRLHGMSCNIEQYMTDVICEVNCSMLFRHSQSFQGCNDYLILPHLM